MAPAASSYLGTEDPYRFQAYFNPKSGKFQSGSDALQRTPGAYSQTTRAMKQMEAFFDVNAYQEQRNRQLQQPERKRQLSRKDIERFKRAKKEKKLNRFRDWLKD
ncbi:hypothetical protein BC940DRAFT_293409 [Gongronella butleri]|nr:hypothetical protein BC940DRAFT_293409 [Gongronella butleri]